MVIEHLEIHKGKAVKEQLLPVNLYHGDGMITTAVQHLPIYISVLDLTDLSRMVGEKQQHTAKPNRTAAGIY